VLLRREPFALLLALGAATGLAARTWITWALFGDPFTGRFQHAFTLAALAAHLPLYALALCTLWPLGLLFTALYRGERRAELLATTLCALLFFSAYDYGAEESSGLRRVILASRFFLPLSPLFALAAAQVSPRLFALLAARGPLGARLARLLPAAALLLCALLVPVAFAVHPLYAARGAWLDEAQTAVCASVPHSAVLVGNAVTLGKVVSPAACDRDLLERAAVTAERLPRLAASGPVDLAFLERTGGSGWDAEERARDDAYLVAASALCRLTPVLDAIVGPAGEARLRVLHLTGCAPPPAR
jgi:hypothetical protein